MRLGLERMVWADSSRRYFAARGAFAETIRSASRMKTAKGSANAPLCGILDCIRRPVMQSALPVR